MMFALSGKWCVSATHDVAFGNDVCLRHMKGKHRIIVSDSEQHHFCASRFIISRYSGGIIDLCNESCYNQWCLPCRQNDVACGKQRPPERPDEKSPPVGGLFCMVDVKELESLTTRTSSECVSMVKVIISRKIAFVNRQFFKIFRFALPAFLRAPTRKKSAFRIQTRRLYLFLTAAFWSHTFQYRKAQRTRYTIDQIPSVCSWSSKPDSFHKWKTLFLDTEYIRRICFHPL